MNIKENIQILKAKIHHAEQESGRAPGSVLLLAVSKQQTEASILEAFRNGIQNFGENYFQEAQGKIQSLKEFPLQWHFIGPIQSNKTKGIAELFSWVHSVNRIKIAQLLDHHRPGQLPTLNVCIQINLIEEFSKSGITPEDAKLIALEIKQLPRLKLRGLMTIPPPEKDPKKQYQVFLQLKKLMQELNQDLDLNMDTLSMGMSDDLIPAIKAGSTIVRIGRALFGERTGKTL